MDILKNDSRKSFVDIGKEIGLSESAVRRRVRNLVDTDVIKRFTVDIDSGDKTSAITLLSISSSADTAAVTAKLQEVKGVKIIYEITGQFDIAAIISAPSISEINHCIDPIRKIE